MTRIRTSADRSIVNYNLDIGGLQSTRHRKYLRKLVGLPNHDEAAVEHFPNADEGVMMAGQDNERDHMPSQRPLRLSARIQSGEGRRC